MTDYERTLEFLKSLGIGGVDTKEFEGKKYITLEQGNDEKIRGYRGFFTDFEFTMDGSFISVGAWE